MLTKLKNKIAALTLILSAAFFAAAPALAADFTWPNNDGSITSTDFWGYTGGGSVHYYGQTFTAYTKNIHSVAFKLNREATDSNVTTNNRQLIVDILEGTNCGTGTVVGTYTMSATNVIANFPYHTDSTYAIPVYATLTPGDQYCARLKVSTFTGGTFFAVDLTGDTYSGGNARRELNDNLWHDVSGGDDAWFQITGELPDVYGIDTPGATILQPAAYDIIRGEDLENGLEVIATSDHLESAGGTITFKYYLSHYGVDAATGTLAVNSVYTSGSNTFDAVSFTADPISIPDTCGVSNCEYLLGVGACFGNYCGSYDTLTINVLNSSTSTTSSGSTQPLNTTNAPFPTFDCSGSITDLCVGYTLGTWVPNVFRWLIVPPSIGAFNASPIFAVFQTRWPLAYVFAPIAGWQSGYAAGVACPLPTFLGNTMFGHTMPTFDFCANLALIGGYIDGSAFGSTTVEWAIYLGALFMVWKSAEGLHKSHKK